MFSFLQITYYGMNNIFSILQYKYLITSVCYLYNNTQISIITSDYTQPKCALHLHLICTKKCKLGVEYVACFGALVLMLYTIFLHQFLKYDAKFAPNIMQILYI